jgi:toxin YoeB
MEITYSADAKEDLLFWRKSGNKAIQKKITSILNSILETPFEGIGKPEPLKYDLSGKWSRRINQEHRLIYDVTEVRIKIYSLRGHYN